MLIWWWNMMTFIPDSPDPEAWQVLRNENLAVRVQEPLGQVQVLVTIFTFFHICSIYYICSKGKPFCWIWWWYHWTFEANRCRKIHVHFAKEGCDLHPEDSGKVEDPTARGATDWYRSMEGSQVMEVPQNRHPVMDDHDLVLKQPWWLGVRPQISYTTSCKTSIFLQILKNSYTFSYKSSNFHGSAIDFSWTKLFFPHIFSIKFPWTKMFFYKFC